MLYLIIYKEESNHTVYLTDKNLATTLELNINEFYNRHTLKNYQKTLVQRAIDNNPSKTLIILEVAEDNNTKYKQVHPNAEGQQDNNRITIQLNPATTASNPQRVKPKQHEPTSDTDEIAKDWVLVTAAPS